MPVVLSAASYGFNSPTSLAFDGSHLWVANNFGTSVSVIHGP
jgi:hypothetical protein